MVKVRVSLTGITASQYNVIRVIISSGLCVSLCVCETVSNNTLSSGLLLYLRPGFLLSIDCFATCSCTKARHIFPSDSQGGTATFEYVSIVMKPGMWVTLIVLHGFIRQHFFHNTFCNAETDLSQTSLLSYNLKAYVTSDFGFLRQKKKKKSGGHALFPSCSMLWNSRLSLGHESYRVWGKEGWN